MLQSYCFSRKFPFKLLTFYYKNQKNEKIFPVYLNTSSKKPPRFRCPVSELA